MSLIPWRHKRKDGSGAPLMELRHEMDRVFDSFMRDPFGSLSETFGGTRDWLPAVDVAENDREVIVRAEIPGVDPKDLEITVSGDRLTIAGEKKESSQHEGKDFHVSESHFGAFRRTVELPSTVDTNNVTATSEHGVLTVKLQKSQAASAKRVEIKTQ